MTLPRNAAVPAALRPKTGPASPAPVLSPVAVPVVPADAAPVVHLALVVPDARIQRLLKDHCFVIGPVTSRTQVVVHAVLDDKAHQAAGLEKFFRWALVETGLVPPEEVGYITSAQVELGWPTHEKDTA